MGAMSYTDLIKKKKADEARINGIAGAIKIGSTPEQKKANESSNVPVRYQNPTKDSPGYGSQNEGKNIKPATTITLGVGKKKYEVKVSAWESKTNQAKAEFIQKSKEDIRNHLRTQGVNEHVPKLAMPNDAVDYQGDLGTDLSTGQNLLDLGTKQAKASYAPPKEVAGALRSGADKIRVLGDKERPGLLREKGVEQSDGMILDFLNPEKMVSGILNLPSSVLSSAADVADPEAGFNQTAMGAANLALTAAGAKAGVNKLKAKFTPSVVKSATVPKAEVLTVKPADLPVSPDFTPSVVKAKKPVVATEPKVELMPTTKPRVTIPGEKSTVTPIAETTQKPLTPPKVPENATSGQIGSTENPFTPSVVKAKGTQPMPEGSSVSIAGREKLRGTFVESLEKTSDKRTWKQATQVAKDSGYDKPEWFDTKIENLKVKNTPLNDSESMAFAKHLDDMNDAAKELDKKILDKATTPEELTALTNRRKALQDKFETVDELLQLNGAEAGRTLAARAAFVKNDFSTTRLLAREKASLKRDLTPQEELKVMKTAEKDATNVAHEEAVTELQKQIKDLEKQLSGGRIEHNSETYMPTHRLEANSRTGSSLEQAFMDHPEKFDPESPTYDKNLHRTLYKHMEGHAPTESQLYESFYHDKPVVSDWHESIKNKLRKGDYVQANIEGLKEIHPFIEEAGRGTGKRGGSFEQLVKKGKTWVMSARGKTREFVSLEEIRPDLREMIVNYVKNHGDNKEHYYVRKGSMAKRASAGGGRQPDFKPLGMDEMITKEGAGYEVVPVDLVRKMSREMKQKIQSLESKAITEKTAPFNENDVAQAVRHYNDHPDVAREAQVQLDKMRQVDTSAGTRTARRTEFKAQKAELGESIKNKWKNYKSETDGVAMSTVPGGKQVADFTGKLIEVAPDIIKLASVLAKEGAATMKDAIKGIREHTGLTEKDLSDSDITKIVAGHYTEKAIAKEKSNLVKLKTEAQELAGKPGLKTVEEKISTAQKRIDDLNANGVPESTPRVVPSELKAKLSEYQKLLREKKLEADEASGALAKKKAEMEFRKQQKRINDARDAIESYEYALKSGNLTQIEAARLAAKMKRASKSVSDELLDVQMRKTELRREYNSRLEEKHTPFFDKVIREGFGIPRFLTLGLDAGALLRQGKDAMLFPKEYLGAAYQGIKALSKKKAFERENWLFEQPSTKKFIRDGGAIGREGTLTGTEEAFVSKAMKHIPGYAPSQRFHHVFLNELRTGLYNNLSEIGGMTPEMMKEATRFINAMTGRGDLFGNGGKLGNVVFTAPKLYAGQLQMMSLIASPVKVAKNPALRRLVARRTMGTYATFATMAGLAKLNGAEFSINPEDSDFLKYRKDGVVLDFGGGYTPYYRIVMHTINSLASSNRKNMVKDLPDKAWQQIRYKLSPGVQIPINAISGSDAVGQPFMRDKKGNFNNNWKQAAGSLAPIIARDVYELTQDPTAKNVSTTTKVIAGLSAVGGGGVQVYPNAPKPKDADGTAVGQLLKRIGNPGYIGTQQATQSKPKETKTSPKRATRSTRGSRKART